MSTRTPLPIYYEREVIRSNAHCIIRFTRTFRFPNRRPNRPTTEVTLVRLGSKQPARACKHWVNNGSEWEHFEGSARWPTVTASNTLDDDQAAAVPRDRFSLSTDDAAAPGRETGVGFKRRSNDGNQLNNEDSDTIEFNNECNVIKRAKHTHQFD